MCKLAISDHTEKGNSELGQILNDAKERKDNKIKVTAQVVAQQRQAMKKAGALPSGKKRDRPPGTTQAAK